MDADLGSRIHGGITAQTGWDPLLIAAQVINDALGLPGHDADSERQPRRWHAAHAERNALTSGAPTAYLASGTGTPSGDYISINYPYASFQKVDQIVTQLAGLGYSVGFDFGVDVAYSMVPARSQCRRST